MKLTVYSISEEYNYVLAKKNMKIFLGTKEIVTNCSVSV